MRTPITVARSVAATIATVLAAVILKSTRGDASQFALGLQKQLQRPPLWLVNSVVGSMQFVTFAVPIGALVALVVTRKMRRLGRILVAGLIALGLLRIVRLSVGHNIFRLGRPGRASFGGGGAFPTTAGLAVLVAIILTEAVWWSKRWRRLAFVVAICAVGARLGSALAHPSTIVAAITVGTLSASIALLIFGVPSRRATALMVQQVLASCGIIAQSVVVDTSPDFRGIATFYGDSRDGRRVFVKVVNREALATKFPSRVYRSVRFRNIGDDRPFESLRRRVEYEALCSLKAYSAGVPTPRLLEVVEFPAGGHALIFDVTGLRLFTDTPVEQRTADLAQRVWTTVAKLRASRIAHRRLSAECLLLDSDGTVFIADFSGAKFAADERQLSGDIAEVLAITSARLGVESAVSAAAGELGHDVVASALPRLQPLALTRTTRAAVKEHQSLEPLREHIRQLSGQAELPVENLERVRPRTVLMVVAAALALSALIPQLIGKGDVWTKILHAHLGWALGAVGMSLLTYLGAAIALDGSVPDTLPLGPNAAVQFATSFVGVAAPGGGLALSARFLQRRGVDSAVAVAAVGIDTLAGVIVHFVLIGVFVAWAGSSGLRSFHLPSFAAALVVVGVVALMGLVTMAVPRLRRMMADRVMPPVRRAVKGLADTARHPANLIELFGGSAIITLGYVLALHMAVLAFGGEPPFTSVALVYLVGSVVSSVAPTPGGIGAVEATLVAGLTSAGMASDTAVGAVLTFRMATFWLPMIPGWLAFMALQRSGDV